MVGPERTVRSLVKQHAYPIAFVLLSFSVGIATVIKPYKHLESSIGQVSTAGGLEKGSSAQLLFFRDWVDDFQAFELILIVGLLAFRLRNRFWFYVEMALAGPLVAIITAVLLSICFGMVFSDYGLFILFWSDEWPVTVVSSAIVILTIASLWMMLGLLFVNRVDSDLTKSLGGAYEGVPFETQRHYRLSILLKTLDQTRWSGLHGYGRLNRQREDRAATADEGETIPARGEGESAAAPAPSASGTLAAGRRKDLFSYTGWFIWTNTWPIALLLAVPALMPRFAVVQQIESRAAPAGAGPVRPINTATPFLVTWLADLLKVPRTFRSHDVVIWASAILKYYLYIGLPWLLGLAIGLSLILLAIYYMKRVPAAISSYDLSNRTLLFYTFLLIYLFMSINASLISSDYTEWTLFLAILAVLALMLFFLWPFSRRKLVAALSVELAFAVPFGLLMILKESVQVGLASSLSLCFLLLFVSLGSTTLSLAFAGSIDFGDKLKGRVEARQVQAAGVVVLGLILLLNGLNPYKIQFKDLSAYYPEDFLGRGEGPRSLNRHQSEERDRRANPAREGPGDPMADDLKTLDRWEKLHRQVGLISDTPDDHARDRPLKPRLVVIACSGGGLRSALWTVKVLESIEKSVPELPQSTRMIFGASGGMLGAAHYVTSLEPDPKKLGLPRSRVASDSLVEGLKWNFLGESVRYLAFKDFFSIVSPFAQSSDRGLRLEQAWINRMPGLDKPFAALRREEKEGRLPSLVFSPMIVEDSRRLLISNLDLTSLTLNHGLFDPVTRAERYESQAPEAPFYSTSGIQLFRLFPQAYNRFRIRTAVRMSATFPVISPAAALPTDPPRRVVDAGFYDNYGVDLAASWLDEHRHWLLRHTSGVALIQIRAFTNEHRLRELDLPSPRRSPLVQQLHEMLLEPLDRGTQFLTSAISGAGNARQYVTSYRNDAAIEMLKRRFAFDRLAMIDRKKLSENEAPNDADTREISRLYDDAKDFFRVFTFTCADESIFENTKKSKLGEKQALPEVETLNWFLGERDFQNIVDAWYNKDNRVRFNMLLEFFGRRALPMDDFPDTTRRVISEDSAEGVVP